MTSGVSGERVLSDWRGSGGRNTVGRSLRVILGQIIVLLRCTKHIEYPIELHIDSSRIE